jgi:DNA polymerase bacteriophage-type
MIVIDFETYFDQAYSLKKLTIPEYVHDARFKMHGIAIWRPGRKSEFRADAAAAITELQAEFGQDLERTTVVCHHAQFDLYILNHLYSVRPRFLVDTLQLARHVHGSGRDGAAVALSLKALAERYGLERKLELEFMEGLREPDPQQMADLAAYACRDVEITAALMEKLLPQLTRPTVELAIQMHTVRLFTERSVRVDVEGIAELESAVLEETRQAHEAAGVTPEITASDKLFVERLECSLAMSQRSVPLKQGKKGMIPATAKDDLAMQQLLTDSDPVVAALARARVAKKSQDQKLARLGTLRRIAAATGGVLPPYLAYCGGRTGRFSGGDGFNIQNLSRNGLGGQIRGLLKARPGHVLVIADLSQIEARITAWCAGQHEMLEAFRAGRDLYSEFASQTFGREVRKPRDTDQPHVKQELTALRQVGKAAVLGLGFGQGALRFLEALQAAPETAELFATGQLNPRACREIVDRYRSGYPEIQRFWRELEDAAGASVNGGSASVGPLRLERQGETTLLWLPSGRALRYPDLRLEVIARSIKYLDRNGIVQEFTPEGHSLTYGGDTSLYGAKLCENIVQAMARDLLVEAILRMEQRGLRVLFHVHDEVIIEVPAVAADPARLLVEYELKQVPGWAEGLPVMCEVAVADRYGK